jgi:hypothetical protein
MPKNKVLEIVAWVQQCDDAEAVRLVRLTADCRLTELVKRDAYAAGRGSRDTSTPYKGSGCKGEGGEEVKP